MKINKIRKRTSLNESTSLAEAGSAGLHISSNAKRLSDVQNYADFDWRSRLLKRNVHISE